MRRRSQSRSRVLAGLSAVVLAGALVAGGTAAQARPKTPHHRPDRVVIITVDALSRELVEKYDMRNVQALMKDGVNARNAYLGHVGSVTVVTHNVITQGLLPKNMGWSTEGYRDVNGVLKDQSSNPLWLTSDWTKDQLFAVQKASGAPKLADYLHTKRPGSKVFTVSPKAYAAWAYGGQGSDSIVTYSSANYDCDGDGVNNWRGPSGVNVPTYLSDPTCGRFYINSDKAMNYDTGASPARMYPLDGNRYTIGHDAAHEGGDVWATDAALSIMDHEKNWSGIFLTLPGVDKSAHMWGGVTDPGSSVPGYDPMTHIQAATKVADEQVGRVIAKLRASGELNNTLVVLTADHGQVPGTHFHGLDDGTKDRGYYNWYYGDLANGQYLKPQPDLKPLIDTGNVELNYADSMISTWLKDRSKAKVKEAVKMASGLPGVTAVWVRHGSHYDLRSPIRYDLMKGAERQWFRQHAQELVNTAAGPTGPDMISTLADDTTYSVAGDHGGIQRRAQQIPIVFAGAVLSGKDLTGRVRSVDITPTILREMGIKQTTKLDGVGWHLPS